MTHRIETGESRNDCLAAKSVLQKRRAETVLSTPSQP